MFIVYHPHEKGLKQNYYNGKFFIKAGEVAEVSDSVGKYVLKTFPHNFKQINAAEAKKIQEAKAAENAVEQAPDKMVKDETGGKKK